MPVDNLQTGGNLVVFVPGTCVATAYYEPFLQALQAVGATTLTVSPPGWGGTPSHVLESSQLKLVAEQHVPDAIELVVNNISPQSVIVVGHATGGHAVLRYVASQRPDVELPQFAGVVLIGVATGNMVGACPAPQAAGVLGDTLRIATTGLPGNPHREPGIVEALAEIESSVLALDVLDDPLASREAVANTMKALPRARWARAVVTTPPGYCRWAQKPDAVVDHIFRWWNPPQIASLTAPTMDLAFNDHHTIWQPPA